MALVSLATLGLIALLVVSGARKENQAQAGVKVDIKRIEKLVLEGKLTLHPAEFFRKVNSPEDSE